MLEAPPLTSSSSWLDLRVAKCGAGSDSGPSCCKRNFDDDDFEKEEARLHQQAREREQATVVGSETGSKGGEGDGGAGSTKNEPVNEDGSGVVRAQPAPAKAMEPPRRSSEGAVQ